MRFLASLTTLSVAVLTLAGCPAGTPMCPPDGTGFNEGTGLYCAYGVVVGGFRNCPTDLPNRFDFADGSFVCSSRPIGSRDAIPDAVCAALTACSSAGDAGSSDAGSSDAGSSDAGSSDAGSPDAGLPDVGPSDVGMLGDVTLLCGFSTCRGDQVCRATSAGTDGGTTSYACFPLPPSCVGVTDCMFCSDPAQRACLQDVCMLPQGSISSGGRLIVCPGA
jgi:hypothetical protein